MVFYKCNLCNFETSYKTRYSQHLQTKKHLGKVKEQESKKKKMNPK